MEKLSLLLTKEKTVGEEINSLKKKKKARLQSNLGEKSIKAVNFLSLFNKYIELGDTL